jgi:hypothetical protein
MRKTEIVLALAAFAAVTAGCSSGRPASAHPATTAPANSRAAQPRTFAWGQSAYVLGANGNELKVTPVGVLYSKGPYRRLPNGSPTRGWWIAIAVQAEAVTAPDAPGVAASGGGFSWYGQGEDLNEINGGGSDAPWVGRVPVFDTTTQVQPGQPQIGVLSFDVPTRTGAFLRYANPNSAQVVSWSLPGSDQGTGLDAVTTALKQFS